RQAADVPRAQGEALWRRFKAAHDEAWKRCESHFAAQAEARAENLAKKVALCERAESLAGSTSWIQTADEIKRLQAEWKRIGPVKKSRSEALWQRFRGACDHFFTRYAQRHDVTRAERIAAREAICQELEGLADDNQQQAAGSQESPVDSAESVVDSSESATPAPDSAVRTPQSALRTPHSALEEPPADLMAKVRP